jgi:hypothetical protein
MGHDVRLRAPHTKKRDLDRAGVSGRFANSRQAISN